MSARPGPAKGGKKCGEKGCECTNFEPDAFRKDKCRNCFHVHPSTDAPSSPPSVVNPVSPKPVATPGAFKLPPLARGGSDRTLVEKAALERASEKAAAAQAATDRAVAAERIAAEKAAIAAEKAAAAEKAVAEKAHTEKAAEHEAVREKPGAQETPPADDGAESSESRPFRAAPPPSRKVYQSATFTAPLPRPPPAKKPPVSSPPVVPSPIPPASPPPPRSTSPPADPSGSPSHHRSTSAHTSPPATTSHTSPPAPASPAGSDTCDHAAAIEEGVSFCLLCGSRIPEAANADLETLCICGNRYEDWDKYCTRCGDQPSTSRGKLFDGLIDCHTRFSPYAVPKIVYDCTEYLKQHALKLEGIFRVPGNNEDIQSARADFEQEYKVGKESTDSPVANCSDPHTVAGILKLYYRKLRAPVVPFPAYDDWINFDKSMSSAAQFRKLRTLVVELPATHRILLAYHLDLLRRVGTNVADTKMGPKNCAMVFAPGLIRKPEGEISDAMLAKEMALSAEVIEILIVRYDELFPEGCPDPKGPKPAISTQPLVLTVKIKPGERPSARDTPVPILKPADEKALEKQREEMEEFAARQQQNLFKIQAMPQKEALEAQFQEFMATKRFVPHSLAPVSEKLLDHDKWQVLCLTNEVELAVSEGKASMKDPLALYEGWLLLIINHSSKHSNYFFSLRPGVLRYYTEKGDKKPVGEITFTKSTSRYQNSNSTTKSPNPQFPYPFILDTHPDSSSNGKYALYAESKDSREAWLLLLELAIISDPEKNKPLSADSHAYDMTLGMMIGIRTSVGRSGGTSLTGIAGEKDFHDIVSYNFPSKGSKETPPHKLRDFGFKDYCPNIFRRIRQYFGIDPSSYLLGVCGNADYLNFVSNSRSGEFFFYSHDRKYMIKTISQNECKCLFANMSSYYRHLMSNRDCFINKFFGLHKVKPADQSCKWFLVMGSVFPSHLKMHRLFDLKGSTHNRQVKPSDRGKDGTVYKDNDFVQQGATLVVGPDVKAKLEKQLKKDVEWLESLRIIDYSVLVGMHYRQGFYASATNVQVFVSDSFFSDSLGQTLELEFKVEDTVADVLRQCVKMMRALPKMQLHNPAQDFCFVRSDGREVLDDKAQMSRQTPLSLMEIILKEAVPKSPVFAALTSPRQTPSMPFVNPKIPQAISSWKSALSELSPSLFAALKGMSDTELLAMTTAEIVAKAKGNPIAGCLLAELKHMVEAASADSGPGLSSFTETEGGLAAKDEMGNDVILYIGIIDTLIEYNLKKKMEHQYKHKVKGLDETSFSVVEPNMYAQRLLGFFTDKIR